MTLKKVLILISFIVIPISVFSLDSNVANNMSLGLKSYQERDFIGAIFYFSKVEKNGDSFYPEALYWLAKSYYNKGDYNDSRIVIEKFFRTGSLVTYYEDATFLYCIIYFKLERYEDSLHLLQQYIRSSDYNYYRSAAYFWLGEAYLQLGNFDKAKESFNTYLEADPGNAIAIKRIETIDNAIFLLSGSVDGEDLTLLDKASWYTDYIIREKDKLVESGESVVLKELALIATKEQFFNWLDKLYQKESEIVIEDKSDIINNEEEVVETEVNYDFLEEKILDELEKKLIEEIGD